MPRAEVGVGVCKVCCRIKEHRVERDGFLIMAQAQVKGGQTQHQ